MWTRPDVPPAIPLAGVRVLDIGTLIAGPFGAGLLADFGAEVVKVEQPGVGDTMRSMGGARLGEVHLGWINAARNKLSVTCNLRVTEGQALLKRLVAISDVLIENFTPGTLEEWGLGWEDLKVINPRLIMVRVSGFGQSGPYSGRAGYDRIALGFSGYMYPTGYPDRPPVRPSIATADHVTAVFGALSALLALYWRDAQGGAGQMVDLALFEPLFRMSEDIVPVFHRLGRTRERIGNRNPGFSPAGNFQTKDGRWIQIAAGGDRVFERLARAMGRPELITDPRYALARDRAVHADDLEAMLAEWLAGITFDEAHALLTEANVPAEGIYTAAEIFADPHYAAREDIVEIEDEQIGPVKVPAVIPKLTTTPGTIRHGGPRLGQHNEQIYGGLLGVSSADLADLAMRGII